MIANLGTLCPGDESLPDVANGEHGGGLDVIPVLLGEGIDAARDLKAQSEEHQHWVEGTKKWTATNLI
jgi:hypothetical protein